MPASALFPAMAWELQAARAAGLSFDELRFGLAFVSACAAGTCLRALRSPVARHLFAIASGMLLLYYPFGGQVAHIIPCAAVSYLAMALAPRAAGKITWMFCFPYLVALHVWGASAEKWKRGELDIDAAMMLLVIKLIGLSVSFEDVASGRPLSEQQKHYAVQRPPGPLAFFSFIFAYGNLLGGPFMEFNDWDDFINRRGVWSPRAAKRTPPVTRHAFSLLFQSFFYLFVHLTLANTFNVRGLTSNWFKREAGSAARLGYLCALAFTQRAKFYFAWLLAEAAATFSEFNFIGYDAKGRPEWGRAACCRPLEVELQDSARRLPAVWNIGTGTFLRRYVYERLAGDKKPGFSTLLLTQLVCALWHGVHSGYFMYFASSAVLFEYAKVVYKWERKYASPAVQRSWLLWTAKVAMTQLLNNYIAGAFILLDWRRSLACWGSLGFAPHVVMIGVLVAGQFVGNGGGGGARRRDKAVAPPPEGIDGKAKSS